MVNKIFNFKTIIIVEFIVFVGEKQLESRLETFSLAPYYLDIYLTKNLYHNLFR